MDFWEVVKQRHSCRKFTDQKVEHTQIENVLMAASFAPSPANRQPWQFVVISNKEAKHEIYEMAGKIKEQLFALSNWRWLKAYQVEFLLEAPVLIAVIGDPAKTGADKFLPDRGEGYEHACAAAIQNMLLAATAEGLGSLWFTLFDKVQLSRILKLEENKDVIALVCLGYSDDDSPRTGRTNIAEATQYWE